MITQYRIYLFKNIYLGGGITGIPYQGLINFYLRDCAATHKNKI